MSKRFSFPPRTNIGDQFNELTVVHNLITYRGRERLITVSCSCGSVYLMREYAFMKKIGGGVCQNCSLALAGVKRRLPNGDSARNDYRNDYIQNAKSRGHSFELTKEQFDLIISRDCHYCGAKPNKRKASRNSVVIVNGVDRYDNSYGYSLENSVPCCWTCNSAKRAMHGDEFIEWARSIAAIH